MARCRGEDRLRELSSNPPFFTTGSWLTAARAQSYAERELAG